MAFRLKKRESVANGIFRIADEQIGKAIDELENSFLESAEVVHQVRKRCKKIRGLVRLVRPRLKDAYETENAWYRDTARMLSELRDAKTMLNTYDTLMEHFGEQVDRRAFSTIRRELTRRRKQLLGKTINVNERLEVVRSRFLEGRVRVEDWSLRSKGYEAVRPGLEKTYDRARKAMKQAGKKPSAETFHEWRKRVKYHWYHSRLLQDVWPEGFAPRRNAAHRLSDWLGDDHDLAVAQAQIAMEPDAFGNPKVIQTFLALIQQQRKSLEKRSFLLGKRLLAEEPQDFSDRIGRYWKTWKKN